MASDPNKWDVFLSFRGADTRDNFTSHLFSSLDDKGVNVFMDERLQKGGDISTQLIDIIRGSRISVVVFSENYAASRWCLQELCEIMDCRKNNTPPQVVLPVFYDVSPSDVRKQTGDFGKAFAAKYEKNEEFARWRAVLTEAGSLSGWDLKTPATSSEAKIVKKIGKRIYEELQNTYLEITKYPIGLERRMMRVNKQLNDGSADVRFIVITGIRGIGKTTLASAIYNQFFHTFEAKYFLADVGDKSKQLNSLQEQLLRGILKFEKIKVKSVQRGCSLIKERLCRRRVLIVLDDVTHRDQLNVLAQDRGWFGPGSRILISTEDPDSVKEIKADDVYILENLDDDESLELFSRHAFERSHPIEEFCELSKAIVGYCEGLPLALEIMGSFLLNQNAQEWKSTLNRLGRIPHDGIQEKLEISYHGLGRYKELLLDIACFFVGRKKGYVAKILDGRGIGVDAGLRILTRRNLVKITSHTKLSMHKLIQDMAKEIVLKESRNPGERSRLFFHDDIISTLRSNLGTVRVEGLGLYSSELTEKSLFEKAEAEAFSGMKRLRLLHLDNLRVDGNYGLISKELRWLSWYGFPLNFVPDELYMENLVILDMRYSNLRATWKTSKNLRNLKVLNFSHSHFLTKTPNFSNMPNLEELIMKDCRELKEVDGSIGVLESLVSVNLKDCRKLRALPNSICRVKTLQTLDISGCSMIDSLPNNFGELASLAEFHADGAPITNLPLSFANLKNLSKLSLYGYNRSRPSSISALVWSWIFKKEAPQGNNQLLTVFSGLRSLTDLCLRECNLSDDSTLESIGSLQSLTYLDLSRSDFCRLPNSISSLSNLEWFTAKSCPKLESLLGVPPKVEFVRFKDCPSLTEISFSGKLSPFLDMYLAGCENLSAECVENIIKSWPPVSPYISNRGRLLYMPGSNIPECFEYKNGGGSSLTFQLPSCHDCELNKITVSLVVRTTSYHHPTPHYIIPDLFLTATPTRREIIIRSSRYFLDYFGVADNIGIFSVEPSTIMGGVQYPGVDEGLGVHLVVEKYLSYSTDDAEPGSSHIGTSMEYFREDGYYAENEVVLEVKPHPDYIVKALGVHLDVDKCPSCRLIEPVGPSHGRSSDEHRLGKKPATDLPVKHHRWVLEFACPSEREYVG